MTREDFIFDLWRDLAGYGEVLQISVPSLDKLRQSEWCLETEEKLDEILKSRVGVSKEHWPKFKQLMKNRLIMGRFRYGGLNSNKPNWDRLGRADKEAKLWYGDKYWERIIDIANMYFLEYIENGKNPLMLQIIVNCYYHYTRSKHCYANDTLTVIKTKEKLN